MQSKVTSKNEQLVIKSAETLPERIRAAAARGLAQGLLGVAAMAQLDFLSGPRPGKIQSITGRLRQGVNTSVEVSGDRIVGRIGNNVKYAARHEFGFHGIEQVKAHTRVVDQTFANFTDSVAGTRKRAVSLDGDFHGFTESRKRASGRQRTGFVGIQHVRAHTRKINYAGKPFIRPALEASKGTVEKAINAEVATVKA